MKRLRNISLILATLLLFCSSALAAPPVFVSGIEELYTAVNNPANIGVTIFLAPGNYMLTPNDPTGTERPNRGRLELQEDMSIIGRIGNRSAVVIDASLLPRSSYQGGGPPLTGAIRLGRGSNTVG